MNPLYVLVEDLVALSDGDLEEYIARVAGQIEQVGASPAEFVSADRTVAALLDETRAAVASVTAARDVLASRGDDAEELEEAEELSDEAAAELAELARAAATDTEELEEEDAQEFLDRAPGEDPNLPSAHEPKAKKAKQMDADAAEAVTAAAAPARHRLPRPGRDRRPAEQEQTIALTAAVNAGGIESGDAVPDMETICRLMDERRRHFGIIPEGTKGEKIPIVRARYGDRYSAERTLGTDVFSNKQLIDAVIDPRKIKAEFETRKRNALVASGGLCAPVTPYYNLQMVSIAERPVRAALPSFNADRGGIRYARPAVLSAVTTATDIITAAQDSVGGTTATKTCQTVPCPAFQETDVQVIYHCIQFGNLGARTFPELLAQWNQLVLADHARTAETALLDAIAVGSTAVLASNLGLGASATLFSQIMTAADGMRSRHRMGSDAVLRVLLPFWAVDLIVSDVIRGQFQRFDTDAARVVALLRSINVEPSFYIDGPTGLSQVYGAQNAGALLAFPPFVEWFIYPEGSWLFLDGGVLELGLVRDSVLNKTNDFQIFGESFEAAAFVGVESLAIKSTVCDTGAVSLPKSVTTCVYS